MRVQTAAGWVAIQPGRRGARRRSRAAAPPATGGRSGRPASTSAPCSGRSPPVAPPPTRRCRAGVAISSAESAAPITPPPPRPRGLSVTGRATSGAAPSQRPPGPAPSAAAGRARAARAGGPAPGGAARRRPAAASAAAGAAAGAAAAGRAQGGRRLHPVQPARARLACRPRPADTTCAAGASLELGELEPAIESLASAIDLAPHFVDARLAYAVALCRLGDVPRAAQTLRAGLGHARTAPARAALWLTLGEVLTTGGDFVAAEDAFVQAALHPAYAARAAAGRGAGPRQERPPGDAIASLLRAVGRVGARPRAGGRRRRVQGEEGGEASPRLRPPPPRRPRRPSRSTRQTSGAGQPPPSVTPERKALAEKVLGHMEAIAAAGDANQATARWRPPP